LARATEVVDGEPKAVLPRLFAFVEGILVFVLLGDGGECHGGRRQGRKAWEKSEETSSSSSSSSLGTYSDIMSSSLMSSSEIILSSPREDNDGIDLLSSGSPLNPSKIVRQAAHVNLDASTIIRQRQAERIRLRVVNTHALTNGKKGTTSAIGRGNVSTGSNGPFSVSSVENVPTETRFGISLIHAGSRGIREECNMTMEKQ
jgi:hypothetical protein